MYISLILIFILYFVESKFTEDNLDNFELRNADVLDAGSIDNEGSGSGDESGNCYYSKWSDWSECTEDCIDFEHIPTKFRTRKLIRNKTGDCPSDGLGTLQFEICTEIPNCNPGAWIKNTLTDPKMIDTYDKIRGQIKLVYPEWVITAIKQYPDIIKNEGIIKKLAEEYKDKDDNNDVVEENEEDKGKYFKYKFVILKSVKKSKLDQIKCGCQSGYKQVTFSEFIKNNVLMNKLTQLCEKNKFNELVFEGNGRYVYYCNIGMIIKDVESEGITCDSLDSNEYVPCKKRYIKTNKFKEWLNKFIESILNGIFVIFCFFIFILSFYNSRAANTRSN